MKKTVEIILGVATGLVLIILNAVLIPAPYNLATAILVGAGVGKLMARII